MKAALHKLSARADTMMELLSFLWSHKLWWLIPMVVVLAIVGILIVFASASPLAPFIYPLI